MPTRYHRFAGSSLERLAALQLNAVIAPRFWILDRA
jgi:hypothetical protein